MNENGMTPTHITIKQKKKHTATGKMVRAAAFARFKVIELAIADNVPFYVVFYQDALIYGGPVERVRDGSFIQDAFQKGIVFEAPHPVLALMAPRQSLSIPNHNKLFTQLQHHYSSLENAFITATLDSFFDKDDLIDKIHEMYGQLKRDGKHFKAYQILRKLKAFAPDAGSVKHQFLPLDFQETYNDIKALRKKDPLYYEQYLFEHRSNPDFSDQLKTIYEEESRPLDSLLLWIETASIRDATESVLEYTDIALKQVSMESWLEILSSTQVNPYRTLPNARAFVEAEIKKGNHEKAASLLLPFLDDLPESFDPILGTLWSQLDPEFTANHLEDLLPALKQMATTDQEKPFNQLLFQLASYLLQGNELETVQERLAPVKKIFPKAAALRKIDQMASASEDPDRMMQLGKDFAEFGQYDQAIECFSLAMEFQPEEPSPVWYLSKMYQQKGMVKEAEAYQQFFTELKKA